MAGKGGSRRHPTSRFSGNVEVGGTSYQMLEGLPFLNGGRRRAPSIKINVLTFLVNNSLMKLSRTSIFFKMSEKTLSQISSL